MMSIKYMLLAPFHFFLAKKSVNLEAKYPPFFAPPLSLDLLKLAPLFGPPQKLAPPPYHTLLACPPPPPLTIR